MSDFIFLFRFTSYGSEMRTEILQLTSCYGHFLPSVTLRTRRLSAAQSRLTWVVWQVREGNRLALHLVWEAAQGHADFNLLRDVLVLVGWSLKHDGDLPVHVRLGELPARLPRPSPEDDLYVVCGSVTTHRATLIRRTTWEYINNQFFNTNFSFWRTRPSVVQCACYLNLLLSWPY